VRNCECSRVGPDTEPVSGCRRPKRRQQDSRIPWVVRPDPGPRGAARPTRPAPGPPRVVFPGRHAGRPSLGSRLGEGAFRTARIRRLREHGRDAVADRLEARLLAEG
jgi:hypothetical protein